MPLMPAITPPPDVVDGTTGAGVGSNSGRSTGVGLAGVARWPARRRRRPLDHLATRPRDDGRQDTCLFQSQQADRAVDYSDLVAVRAAVIQRR